MAPSPSSQVADRTSLFLLPFEETPIFTLEKPGQPPKTLHRLVDDQSEPHVHQSFQQCLLKRTSTEPLDNGTVEQDNISLFCITVGQYVLLRPVENSVRPGVGKIVSFFKRDSYAENLIRVQWFYRAEDLAKSPTEAAGEDELFETQHFDDLQVATIVGRCMVTSYVDWVNAVIGDRNTRSAIAHNQHSPDISNSLVPKESPFCSLDTQQAAVASLHASASDDEDEIRSTFWENYSESAVRYFCKRFYDPISNLSLASKFENEDADPIEELAALRAMGSNFQADVDEFCARDSNASSSDDGASLVDSELEQTLPLPLPAKRPSARPRSSRKGAKRRGRPQGSSQFALPQDIGVPAKLPCRDAQKEHVRKFLLGAIHDSASHGQGGSRCLYISGVPGTGKTATVHEVLRDLRALRLAGDIPPFEALEVNAMSLPDPNLVYSELYAAITGNRGVAPLHAAQLLEKRFSEASKDAVHMPAKRGQGKPTGRGQGSCTIVLLDEMDVLLARKQKVLYDMLDWPTRKGARMAVIGIANTMDLPERLIPRLGSRLGLNRLSYPPYTSAQLRTILDLTLDQTKIQFAPTAIQLCAAKVGAVSGDVRRALELCRRASEVLAESLEETKPKSRKKQVKKIVEARHINEAIQDVAGGARLTVLTQLSLFERLFLTTSISLARSQGSFDVEATCSEAAVTTQAIDSARRFSVFFKDSGIPSTYELEEACWRLAGQNIILIEKTALYRNSRVIVNVSVDDCTFALRECKN